MKLSKFLLCAGIILLYGSSIFNSNIYLAILGAGFLGAWYEYNPNENNPR